MSGSRPTPAEQHLGDRLAALVDGELGHDARERVLAHLATCPKCKAEADAQRRLKNVFAEAAPPPPSASFLARLQGLPGGGGSEEDPFRGGGLGGSGIPGMKQGASFGYVPPAAHAAVLPGGERGFRIHAVGRPDEGRSASRGRRFAFAAAGAVSLAAIALGGVPADTGDTRGSGSGSNVTPLRTQGTGVAQAPESQRRRGSGPLLTQAQRGGALAAPVASAEAGAPPLPGIPSPALHSGQMPQPLAAPLLTGASAMAPLIGPVPAVTGSAAPTVPIGLAPGLSAQTLPVSSPADATAAAESR